MPLDNPAVFNEFLKGVTAATLAWVSDSDGTLSHHHGDRYAVKPTPEIASFFDYAQDKLGARLQVLTGRDYSTLAKIIWANAGTHTPPQFAGCEHGIMVVENGKETGSILNEALASACIPYLQQKKLAIASWAATEISSLNTYYPGLNLQLNDILENEKQSSFSIHLRKLRDIFINYFKLTMTAETSAVEVEAERIISSKKEEYRKFLQDAYINSSPIFSLIEGGVTKDAPAFQIVEDTYTFEFKFHLQIASKYLGTLAMLKRMGLTEVDKPYSLIISYDDPAGTDGDMIKAAREWQAEDPTNRKLLCILVLRDRSHENTEIAARITTKMAETGLNLSADVTVANTTELGQLIFSAVAQKLFGIDLRTLVEKSSGREWHYAALHSRGSVKHRLEDALSESEHRTAIPGVACGGAGSGAS